MIRNSIVSRNILGAIRDQLEESDFSYLADLQVNEEITNEKLIAHIDRVGKVIYERT